MFRLSLHRGASVAVASILTMLLSQTHLRGDDNTPPSSAPLYNPPAILPNDVAELEIALGRIRLVPNRFRVVRKHEKLADGAAERSLQVSTVEGRPSLKVTYSDAIEKFTLDVDRKIGALWNRQYQVNGQRVVIDYQQRPYQPIVIDLTISTSQSDSPQTQKIIKGETLWHIVAANEPEFQLYVLPSLQRLNSKWDMITTVEEVRNIRKSRELSEDSMDADAVLECVEGLDSAQRTVRCQAADRLHSAGLAAQLPLQQLLRTNLTPQQRRTVEQLLAELEPRTGDTPTRVALWLSGDATWR